MGRVFMFFVGAWIASFATGKPVQHSKEDRPDQKLATMRARPPKFPTPPPLIKYPPPKIDLHRNRNSSYSAGAKMDNILTTFVVFTIMGIFRCAMCCFCKSDKTSRKGFDSATAPAVSSFGQATSASPICHRTLYIPYSGAAVASEQPPIILKCGNACCRSGVILQTAPAVSSLAPIDIPCCYPMFVLPDYGAAETPNVLSGQYNPGHNEDSPTRAVITFTMDINRPPEYSTVISATQGNAFPEVRHADQDYPHEPPPKYEEVVDISSYR